MQKAGVVGGEGGGGGGEGAEGRSCRVTGVVSQYEHIPRTLTHFQSDPLLMDALCLSVCVCVCVYVRACACARACECTVYGGK